MARETKVICDGCGKTTEDATGDKWLYIVADDDPDIYVYIGAGEDTLIEGLNEMDFCSKACLVRKLTEALP